MFQALAGSLTTADLILKIYEAVKTRLFLFFVSEPKVESDDDSSDESEESETLDESSTSLLEDSFDEYNTISEWEGFEVADTHVAKKDVKLQSDEGKENGTEDGLRDVGDSKDSREPKGLVGIQKGDLRGREVDVEKVRKGGEGSGGVLEAKLETGEEEKESSKIMGRVNGGGIDEGKSMKILKVGGQVDTNKRNKDNNNSNKSYNNNNKDNNNKDNNSRVSSERNANKTNINKITKPNNKTILNNNKVGEDISKLSTMKNRPKPTTGNNHSRGTTKISSNCNGRPPNGRSTSLQRHHSFSSTQERPSSRLSNNDRETIGVRNSSRKQNSREEKRCVTRTQSFTSASAVLGRPPKPGERIQRNALQHGKRVRGEHGIAGGRGVKEGSLGEKSKVRELEKKTKVYKVEEKRRERKAVKTTGKASNSRKGVGNFLGISEDALDKVLELNFEELQEVFKKAKMNNRERNREILRNVEQSKIKEGHGSVGKEIYEKEMDYEKDGSVGDTKWDLNKDLEDILKGIHKNDKPHVRFDGNGDAKTMSAANFKSEGRETNESKDRNKGTTMFINFVLKPKRK